MEVSYEAASDEESVLEEVSLDSNVADVTIPDSSNSLISLDSLDLNQFNDTLSRVK